MDKADLLRKVRALAERGVAGEKDAAAAVLERLMQKYGITEDDLAEDVAEDADFRFKDWIEDKLLHQVIFAVMGDVPVYKYRNSRRKVVIVKCTPAERLEIETTFHFYNAHLKEDFRLFYTAFINKNNIFPPAGKVKEKSPAPERSRAELLKMAQIMEGLDRHTLHKMIESGKG